MPEPISDADLLALIEGTLAPHRAAEVAGALRADPSLRARAEGMVGDRAMLTRLPDSVPAPPRTVELAMRRAADPAHHDRRAPAHRRTAMLAAAGLGIAVLVGVLALVINATHPALRAQRLASNPPKPAREYHPLSTEPEVIGPVAEEEAPIEEAPTTMAQDIGNRITELEAESENDPLLEEFLARIEPAPGPEPGATASAMPAEEVASLLREGRLGVRITMDPSIPAGAMDHADTTGGAQRPESARALPASIPVDLPEGAPDDELLRVLDDALASVRARSGVKLEFVRAAEPGRTQPPLATDPRAVLWWSAPPRSWRTMHTREIPVLVAPEPATPAAPLPPASS